MKKKFLSVPILISAIILCALLLASCGENKEELAGTVADLPEKTNTEFFLKINGISGDSHDSQHTKWIDVLDFSAGSVFYENTKQGSFIPFTFIHKVDSATPLLQESCMEDRHIRSAEFEVCDYVMGSRQTVYKVIFDYLYVVKTEIGVLKDGTSVEKVSMISQKQTWKQESPNSPRSPIEQNVDLREYPVYSEDTAIEFEKPVLPENELMRLFNYIKLDGIDGDCEKSEHRKWIDVSDYSMGSKCTYSPEDRKQSSFEELTFTHKVDVSTPLIQQACASGRMIPVVNLDVCKAIAGKETVIYSAKLEKVRIKKAVYGVTEKGEVVETVSVMPEKITWIANEVKLDNTLGTHNETSYAIKED